MSGLSMDPARRGGAAALWTQPLHAPAWWRWPAAAALAILTVPWSLSGPGPNPDLSWAAGLALAQEQGLHFGRDIVFTYGPLGFLTLPTLYVVWQAVAALIFAIVVQLLLCRTLLQATRALPAALAIASTAIVASAPTPGVYPELALILALSLVLLARAEPSPRWIPVAGGLAAAVIMLITPSVGVDAFAAAAAVSAFGVVGRLRSLAELFASFFASVAGLWLLSGNALGDVVPWLRAVFQLVAGYTAGMAIEDPTQHGDIVKALVLVAVISALVLRSAAGLPRLRQVALVLVWTLCAFSAFKEGLVRIDGHQEIFFAVAGAAALSLARGRVMRFAATAVALVAVLWSFGSLGVNVQSILDYPTRVDNLKTNLHVLASNAERTAVLERGRRTIAQPLRLPRAVLRDLRSHTVDVGPVETSAAWALGLHWRPQPVFQSYAVLTAPLDDLNADTLRSSRAPERVLRIDPRTDVDGRNPVFDTPAAYLALVCNYRESYASARVEVLARSTNRCGGVRPLGGVDVAAGQTVHVPAARANELVYARIGIPRPLRERLRELFWKPATLPEIVLDSHTMRFVVATAGGPLLMRMPRLAHIAPSSLVDPHVDRLRLLSVPGPIQIDFYALELREGGAPQR